MGLLVPGSVQWMPAGCSVIHNEIPEQQEGAMEGSQLWLNLPSCDKMQAPWYRDIAPEEMPRWHSAGVAVTVIAGQAQRVMNTHRELVLAVQDFQAGRLAAAIERAG